MISTLPETELFTGALNRGDKAPLPQFTRGFPYAGYRVAVFSKIKEQQIGAPQLGGPAPYYNDEALTSAGLKVEDAAPWTPKVVVDRE